MLSRSFNLLFAVFLLWGCTNTQELNTNQSITKEAVSKFDGEIENINVRCEEFYLNPAFHYVEGMKSISDVLVVKKHGIYALGSAYTGKGRDGDMRLIHFDKKMNETWRKAYEENSVEWGINIQYEEDYLYALATRFINGKADNDIYLLKTDLEGEKIWSKTSGSSDYDVCNDFTINDDQIFVSGRTVKLPSRSPFILQTDGLVDSMNIIESKGKILESFIEHYADSLLLVSTIFENDKREKWLEFACYDLNLNEVWKRKVVDLSGDRPEGGMVLTQAGDIYLMGNLGVDGYGYQILIAKVSITGDIQWVKTYGLLNEGQSMGRIDANCFIYESANQGVIIGGNTGSIYGSGINYIFEIDDSGKSLWAKAYKNPEGRMTAISYDAGSQQYILGGYYRQSLSSDEVSKGFLLAVDLKGDIKEN